jgi:xanthine dehydrogenase molybdenum-binding subunit
MSDMAEIDANLYKRPWTWPLPEMKQIGKSSKDGIRRKDGYEKATGTATYMRDVTIPGQLIGKYMVSPYTHARIVSMDSAPAAAIPGVRAILRWDDPDIVELKTTATYLFLPDTAHYNLQCVGAIVVADTELICDEALKVLAANTTWEELPFILDWNEALADGATLLRPDLNPDNNIQGQRTTTYGDIEAGFAEADKIIEWTLQVEEDVWAGVEPCSEIAQWKDNYLEGWYHGQCPTTAQMALMPLTTASKINLHVPYMGGLFGGLTWIWEPDVQIVAAAVASRRVNDRPVKLLYDTSHFHGSGETVGTYKFKVGVKNNGEITAVKFDTVWCGQTLHDQVSKFREGTKVPNVVHVDTWPYLSRRNNICYKHGGPACTFLEQVWLHVAGELGMDPTLVAEINDGCDGEPMEWVNEHIKATQGFDPTRDSLKEVHAIGKAAFDWDNKWHAPVPRFYPR